MARVLLVVIEALVAVNAFAGGVYAMGGAPDWPREWLDRSPFEDYLVPGLVLVVVVGGSMSVAALVGVVAGGGWMAFTGLVVLVLAWHLQRHSS